MLPIKNFHNIITQTLSSRNFLIQRHQIPDINSILILPSPSAIHHHQTTLKDCHCCCLLWNFSKYKDFIATGTNQKTLAIVDSPVIDESNLRSLELKHLSKDFITQKDGPISRYNMIVTSEIIRGDNGKSYVDGSFYDALSVKCKCRVHFHAFMQDVHKRLHRYKLANSAAYDPIPPVSTDLANDAIVL
nr:10197_t:CDS:2 [Entrophospora candida]